MKKEESNLVLDIYYLSHISWAETIVQRLCKPKVNERNENQSLKQELSDDVHIDMIQQQGNELYCWVTLSILLTN